MRVIVCGEPHSGKTCLFHGLTKLLPRNGYFFFRCCPDGEGSWTYRHPQNAVELRRKGKFDLAFMRYVLEGLAECAKHAPVTLVDVGGVRSPENEQIFRACDAFVILAKSQTEMDAWHEFGSRLGLTCMALLMSDLHGEHSIESVEVPIRGTVARLDRELPIDISPAHEALAEVLKSHIAARLAAKEKAMNTITTVELAAVLGRGEVERTLPNGKTVRQLVWEGSDLERLQAEVFGPKAAESSEPITLDGPAPAWLAVAFVHGIHPRCGRLNDPRLGSVDVRAPKPSGSGEGKNLKFSVKENGEFTLVEFEIEGGVFDANDLEGVRGPAVNGQKGVVLSGRGPNWLTATLAMGYHATRWVACWQPGSGATVAMTHHPERKLGEMIADEVIREARGGSGRVD